MGVVSPTRTTKRFAVVTEEKASGATYTPPELADFVAEQMLRELATPAKGPLRILDPAVGGGELLASLLRLLPGDRAVEIHGFDNDQRALDATAARLEEAHPKGSLHLRHGDFLEFVCGGGDAAIMGGLFDPGSSETFDLVIANPPYVRTQIIGAKIAQRLAEKFGLTGRVDLYHAFVLAIANVLRPHGVAGIIVSNRFMTTKAGASVRRAIRERFNLKHVWDLGDTKLFNAAVLPAVLVAEGLNGVKQATPRFTSIYETKDQSDQRASSITTSLVKKGVVAIPDGRCFRVQHGALDTSNSRDGVWRVATAENDAWLATVEKHAWATFRELGKVRVGVKTCADRVFIRDDWETMPEDSRPELLRPLTTHHIAKRFCPDAKATQRQIVYPHECVNGKRRTIDLAPFPNTRKYLEEHRQSLEDRTYVLDAGRSWYEIWVPQDPAAWSKPKLVFRDISEEPCFWIDLDSTIVNGDCYWLTCDDPEREDLLWLAASVGNSTFIEAFYDRSFNNKLYAGRRRFITQYVEKFPLPDPGGEDGKAIIAKAKAIYDTIGSSRADQLQEELDQMIWSVFGLPIEEVRR